MTRKTPRYYQIDAVKATLEWWREVDRRALASLFVGTGKTFIAAILIRAIIEGLWDCGKPTPKILFIGHRQELIAQPYRTFREEFVKEIIERKLTIGRMGGHGGQMHRDYRANVICCSIQSLVRGEPTDHLIQILKHQKVDAIIIDESHHGVADSYLTLVKTCEEANPQLKILGITATPDRADELSMGMLFEKNMELDKYTYYYPYESAMKDRVAVPYDAFEVKTLMDVSSMKFGTSRFFNQEAMTGVWEVGNPADMIYEAWLAQGGPDITTLAFMPSVEVSAAFIRHLGKHHGVEAGHISSEGQAKGAGVWRWSNAKQDMVKIKRVELLKKFESGDIPLVSNFYVLVEGYDNPRCKRLIMALPTKSPGAEIQMIGRATRPYPGPLYEEGDERAVLMYVGYRGHTYLGQNTIGGFIPEKAEKAAEKLEQELEAPALKILKACELCGGMLQAHPNQRGQLWCPECQTSFELNGKGQDFIELTNAGRPSGKGVHFEPISKLAKADVKWIKNGSTMAVALGTNGSFERSLLIVSPGSCPKVGQQFALIGIYRKIKGREWVGHGKYGYWKYTYEPRHHAIIETGDLEQCTTRAEELSEKYAQAILAAKDKRWRNQPVTPDSPQWKELERLGYEPALLKKGEGSAIQNLCYCLSHLRSEGVID
jgi:superfamily II DNA or RNA helicase